MKRGSREKDIKLLVAKFIKLVESLDPGERLTIRKVAAKKKATSKKSARPGSERSQAKRARP